MAEQSDKFSDLTALFINTTLTRSPGASHTQLLIDVSADIMAKQGVTVDQFRAVDHRIATGVYPDMRTHGWDVDEWPDLFPGSWLRTSWSSAARSGWATTAAKPRKSSSGCTPTPANSTRRANGCTTAGSVAA